MLCTIHMYSSCGKHILGAESGTRSAPRGDCGCHAVNLCALCREMGFETLGFPTVDGSLPGSLEAFHDTVRQVLARLKTDDVLNHCSAGLGRTGTLAASVLLRQEKTPKRQSGEYGCQTWRR